jgi:hypothetical protein
LLAAVAGGGLWTFLALITWGDLQNGPRFGVPWTTYGYGMELLFARAGQAGAVVGVIVWHVAAALLGYAAVVRPLWSNKQLASTPWLLAAGLAPGSYIIMALSRVGTLIAPNAIAPALIAIVVVAACAFFAWRLSREHSTRAPINWRAYGMVGLCLLVALVFSVQIDRGHVVGEGSVFFINNIALSAEYGIGTAGHWPLISQHYDEAAFLYPIIYGLMHQGADASATLTIIYWIMLAFARLSLVTLIYLALRGLDVDRLSPLIVTAFLCLASLALNPASSRLLFDSLSPLAYTLHPSRLLIAVLPLLLVSAMASMTRRASASALAIAALIGVGLSSMAFHIALVLGWGFVIAVLALVSPTLGRSETMWRALVASCVLVLGLITGAYALAVLPDVAQVGLLAIAGLAPLVLFAWLWLRSAKPSATRNLTPSLLIAALCAGCALGLMLFGNVALSKLWPVLSQLWPWSRMSVADRFGADVYAPALALAQSPYCDAGYYWGFRTITGHCGSLPMFARTYGLALVMITAVSVWLSVRGPRRAANDSSPQQAIRMIGAISFRCGCARDCSSRGSMAASRWRWRSISAMRKAACAAGCRRG